MTRFRSAGPRLLRAAALAFFALLLLRGGSARAEFKTLKLPKAGEFQIDLGAIVQDIPPFPTVEKEDDHWVFTGLEAWGVDKKYMSTFHVYTASAAIGPEFISDKDQLEDRMVVYCGDFFWEENKFPVTIGKRECTIHLSPSDPQETMYLQFTDKKDKKYTWRYYGNGDVELLYGQYGKDDSTATYEDGILKQAYGQHAAGKVIGVYTVRGSLAGGEYCYALSSLYVYSKSVKLDEDNEWDPVTGWANPEDKQIKKFTAAEIPLKFTSAAGTPFRIITPVMSFDQAPAAEDLSAFAAASGKAGLLPTLADFGIPEFPACETEEGSVNCHMTGLARWGAPEDELTLSPGTGPAYSYTPDIPGINEIVIWYSENDSVPSISIYTEEGTFTVYDYKGSYMVSANRSGEMPAEYHYRAGYLNSYSVRTEDMVYYHYKPAYALNKNTLAEGPLPPFSCYMITSYASGSFEQWFLDHGEWTGESGPCPLDSSQVPPAKTYEAE